MGTDGRTATRRLYERLQARRTAPIDMRMRGDIGVSAADIAVFEQMLGELEACFRSR